jgi:hypothetical protein
VRKSAADYKAAFPYLNTPIPGNLGSAGTQAASQARAR